MHRSPRSAATSTRSRGPRIPGARDRGAGGPLDHVLHDVGDLDFDPVERGIAIVVAGHSHRPKIETVNGVLFLNPGSAGHRRFKLPVTLATVDLTDNAIRPEIHELVV